MMAAAATMREPSFDIDKLSYEIFSILEAKFLFGCDNPNPLIAGVQPETPAKSFARLSNPIAGGKVRVLSIDAGDGVLAAVSLARLEAFLAKQCGNHAARLVDFFDITAGSGTGGVLAAMLFSRGPNGFPLFTAADALRFIRKNRAKFASAGRKGVFQRSGGIFRRMFGESTLKDTIKPVLIPCYDLGTGSPFVFSRADAAETDSFDFAISDVCAVTCAEKSSAAVRSVDGRTQFNAVGGGIAMWNPTAMAITHVLNNKVEFPFACTLENLLVISLGSGAAGIGPPAAVDLLKIAGDGASEMVDQAVAMAFRQRGATSYVRIQAHLPTSRRKLTSPPATPATVEEELLSQRSVDSVLFEGRRVSKQTNREILEWVGGELIAEHDMRKGSVDSTVKITPTNDKVEDVACMSHFRHHNMKGLINGGFIN